MKTATDLASVHEMLSSQQLRVAAHVAFHIHSLVPRAFLHRAARCLHALAVLVDVVLHASR